MAYNKIVKDGVSLIDLSNDTAIASDVLSPKTFHLADGTIGTGTIPTKTDQDITSSGGVVTIPSGYYAQQYQKQGDPSGDATMTSGDQMLDGITAYSKGVKYTGTIPTKTSADLTVSANTVNVPSGYYASNASKDVPVSTLDDTIISGQAYEEATGDYAWKSTVQVPAGYHAAQTIEKTFSEIFPAPETPATASEMLLGYQAFNKSGKKITGTMANNGAVTNTISTQGGTYTIPAGYHNGSGVVTAQLAAGTQGDITLNKSISSNTATISASQTDTTGYITGTTKTGSTTVSASELVSGNVDITNTSSVDVTNYATAQINDANLIADNIKYGVTVLGIAGQAKGIDEVATIPETKTTDVIKCTTDGYYYAWED